MGTMAPPLPSSFPPALVMLCCVVPSWPCFGGCLVKVCDVVPIPISVGSTGFMRMWVRMWVWVRVKLPVGYLWRTMLVVVWLVIGDDDVVWRCYPYAYWSEVKLNLGYKCWCDWSCDHFVGEFWSRSPSLTETLPRNDHVTLSLCWSKGMKSNKDTSHWFVAILYSTHM